MSSLLRKVKSTISAHSATADPSAQNGSISSHVQTQNISGTPPLLPPPPPLPPKESTTNLFNHFSTLRHRRKSRIDLSTAVESPQSIQARQARDEQRNKEHTISQLPRRLVRKASTFNLHSRGRLSTALTDKGYRKHKRRSEHLFPDADTDTEEEEDKTSQPAYIGEQERPSTGTTVYSEAAETVLRHYSVDSSGSAYSHATAIPVQEQTVTSVSRPPYDSKPLPNPITKLLAKAERAVSEAQTLHTLQAAHTEHNKPHESSEVTWVKMAGPGAEPPLPYEKLKEITHDACTTALSSVTTYEHSKCESWNTSIINTILSQLVGESQASEKPVNYKFVVNSTIIQHGTGAVDPATGRGAGRRGMHAASGAYWNNDKDGMWSFKYEAAQGKGLDVIVGIVWVWVG